MLRCLIVDDELIARKGIERYAQRIHFLKVAGSVRTPAEALPYLNAEIDLMVLDIRMPGMTGFDFLRTLRDPPLTIIITAYPEYALEGFELNVIDYIVKPVPFERFLKACEKSREYVELKSRKNNTGGNGYFFIKVNGKIEKIFFDDILYIEAKENYSLLRTVNGNYFTLVGLGQMEDMVDKEQFLRVHKSFIVQLSKISRIDGNALQIADDKIPVSRKIKKELKNRLLNE